MKWILERGNTRWKLGVFDGDHLIESNAFDAFDATILPTIKPSLILLTGSGSWDEGLSDSLKNSHNTQVVEFKRGDKHPLNTCVLEPESLGTDRIANAFAIQENLLSEFNNSNCWFVIDVGTCVTCDLIVDKLHLGGSISPGIEMRLESMAKGTADLPLVEHLNSIPLTNNSLGLSTEQAILEGAIGGVSAEIIGRWTVLTKAYPNLNVVLTGGDTSALELHQVKPKFADSNLTLKGYNALLHQLVK